MSLGNTKTKTDTQQELQDYVNRIAKEISDGFPEVDIESSNDNDDDDEKIRSSYDYINDCLDFEYIVNSDKQFKSAKLLVAFGGPNIWVNLDERKVQGYWGGDYAERYFTDNMNLEETLEEIYNDYV